MGIEDRWKNQIKEINHPKPDKYDIEAFKGEERLSKRLSRLSICSRRQAERLISQGMVKVDGKIVDSNVPVSDTSYIQIGAKAGIYTPTKENTRIWLYHKPQKLICTHSDPQSRPNIFQHIHSLGLTMPHLISVGRLDFMSEGLMILTNDGDLARALEINDIERAYRVRVFGRTFNEEKLHKMRQGFKIKGRQYGPYIIELIRRQSTNTWLHMKLFEGKNNEIRKVMRKFSLRVNRLIRVRYGPYSIGMVPEPNHLVEVKMTQDLKKLMFRYYKEKTAEAQSRYNKQKSEHMLLQQKKEAKRQSAIQGDEETDENLVDEGFYDVPGDYEEPKSVGLGEKLIKDKAL